MLIHILLLILKILGFAILGLLGLVLLVLLLVLLVPVRYSIIGLSDETMNFEIKVSYLLSFVRGSFKISKESKAFTFSVLWGLLKINPTKKKKDYTKDFVTSEENDETEDENEDFEDTFEEFTEDTDEDFEDEYSEDEESFSSKAVKKEKSKKKKSIREKIIDIKENYINEANKRAVGYILKQLGFILKKILPRKAKGNLCFGTTDPSMTGKLLGALSLIPFMYQRGLNVYPDFESDTFYIQGKLAAKGFVQVGILLVVVVRLLINKDTRSLLIQFLKK